MAITFGSKPAEFKYVELPWDAIAAAGAAKQKRYDEGDKEISNINDTFLKIGSIKVDTPRKQQLVDDYQQQIYGVVDSYSGDIGAALPKIKELQRKINYDMTYGELGAINNRYKSQQESIADIQKYNEEYIKSGGKNGISGEEAQALLNYETNELNNTPVQKSPDGTWTTYQKYHRMPTINMYEEARQIAANMKPQTIEELTGLKSIGGGFYQHGKETRKILEAEAIQMAVEQTMRNDPRFTSYLGWRNEITGKNKAVTNYLQQNIAQTPEGIQYLSGKDATGNERMINPVAWTDEVLHQDFTNAAADAGRIFQQREITRDLDYMHVAPREPKEPKEETPQIGLNVFGTPIANQKQFAAKATQAKNQFGEVVDPTTGRMKADQPGSGIGKHAEKGWAALKGMWNYTIAALQASIPGMQAEGAAKQYMVGQTMMNELEEIGKKYDNPREGLSKQSEEMKKSFPGLQSIKSEITQSNDNWFEKNWPGGVKEKDTYFNLIKRGIVPKRYDETSGTYKYPHEISDAIETYDNNAGIVFNNFTTAFQKASEQAGNVVTVPEKNRKVIETYFGERILPYGTLTTKTNPKNPELSMQELVDENGQLKNVQFVGISDAASGGKLVFNINGKEAIFHPSDQITNSKLVVTQAISQSFQTQKPQVINLSNGNKLRIQPDILPLNGQAFLSDGSNAEYMVRVEQYDKNNNPVNFPGLQTNNIKGEQYYQLYELPSLLGALGVK
jgi:hypothetical protein